MSINTLQFLAIMCTAVAMAAGWAHLLELPNKITLPADAYLTVQQIYRGWALLGVMIVAAVVASLVVFFTFTFPVNQATKNWTRLPDGWQALRRQWEWSHAVNAIVYFVALAALVLSVIQRR